MKNLLLIASLILLGSCSSDDSDSESQNNAPSGTLFKIEFYYPQTDILSSNTYFFNKDGKVVSTRGNSVTSTEYAEYTTTFSYNSNGQIWKSSTTYEGSIDYTEFTFNNGLIIESLRHRNNGDVLRTLYNYNDDNQLINKQHFNANNEETATTNITFNSNGNIENTYYERTFGTEIRDYTYEYDTYNNPQKKLFENQELNSVVGNSFNNITSAILLSNSGSGNTEIIIEYTYNESGYPLTSNEYVDGDLETQVTYTYME